MSLELEERLVFVLHGQREACQPSTWERRCKLAGRSTPRLKDGGGLHSNEIGISATPPPPPAAATAAAANAKAAAAALSTCVKLLAHLSRNGHPIRSSWLVTRELHRLTDIGVHKNRTCFEIRASGTCGSFVNDDSPGREVYLALKMPSM